MLVHVGKDRSVRIDLGLAALLALIAGAINAAGFHAVGYFSANMTGNVSALSDYAASGQWLLAGLMIALLTLYIAGSFVSALLIEIGRKRQIRAIYAIAIAAEGVLLAALALSDLVLAPAHSSPILVLGLSFLMGLQNATTTRISDARVRTTHVSGMATDIGIELAILAGKAKDGDERPVVRSRFMLHALTLAAFLCGGVIGVLAYVQIGSVMLLIVSLLLLTIAVPEIRKAKHIL
ncbi:YoaK family protein [Mesorhizobium sp. CAU 1741]|uniref:YoaK family protein n=1 Tax=Mesorhizobium sp. CAU 1741 TaxID=3140366 RepID=UPI00325AB237